MNKTRFALLISFLLVVPNVYAATSRSSFQDAMRRLWSDHVAYTRLFIVSAASGSSDKDATTQRLLQNQADIGNAVAEFYGRDAGNKLTALLKDHILIAANIVAAAKAGDNAKVTSENKRWHDNAVDLAKFLHGANPKHWPEATLQSALFMGGVILTVQYFLILPLFAWLAKRSATREAVGWNAIPESRNDSLRSQY